MQKLARTVQSHPRLAALFSSERHPGPSDLSQLCAAFLLLFEADELYSRAFVTDDASASSFAEQKRHARERLDACLQEYGLGQWTSCSSRQVREVVKRQYTLLSKQATRTSNLGVRRHASCAAECSPSNIAEDVTLPVTPEPVIGSRIGAQEYLRRATQQDFSAADSSTNAVDASLMAADEMSFYSAADAPHDMPASSDMFVS